MADERLKKDHLITVRLTKMEYDMIKNAADSMGVSLSEALRRMLWTTVILYSPFLMVEDAFKVEVEGLRGVPLFTILKPLPELFDAMVRKAREQTFGGT